jgi:general secretion pathway protein C
MSARWITLLVWAAVAAASLYWGLRLGANPIPVPREAQLADTAGVPRGDLTRLFGTDAPPPVAAAAPEPAPDSRFTLLGVVSPRSPQAAREGLALIAVEGKPPRAFRVGAVVDGTHVLKTVNARGATLGPQDGAATIALNLAPPAPAATGTLPAAAGGFTLPAIQPGRPLPPPPMLQPAPLPTPPLQPPGVAPLPLPPSQGPLPPQQTLPQPQRESNLR